MTVGGKKYVSADPYNWPYDGNLTPSNTVFLVIDMQVDFCGHGGYVDRMGYDLSLTRAPIKPIQNVLAAARKYGYRIIHTREGHRPDLSDLPANKRHRSATIGAEIGKPGPGGSRILTRGEPGWDLLPDVAPIEGETIIDKPGKGSFYATDLELILHTAGIRNIVLAGVTTDVCVHTTMRDANDRGFECLILSDCTAATDPANHKAALQMVKMQGGVFGSVADSTAFIAAITPAPEEANGFAPAAPAPSSKVVSVPTAGRTFELPLGHTAVLMLDFQRDYLAAGGLEEALGGDVQCLQEAVPAAAKLLEAARAAGLAVVFIAEAHLPDLSDLPPSKLRRGNPAVGKRIGDRGAQGRMLIRGEPGTAIVDELAPRKGEKLLYKPGKGAFFGTGLQDLLQEHGITHLLLAGSHEAPILATVFEAADRGFERILITDAVGKKMYHKDDWIALLTTDSIAETTTSSLLAKALAAK